MPDGHRNPFEGVTDFFSELNRMREIGAHGRDAHPHQDRQRTHASAWVPATDVFRRDEDLVIRIEVAGLRPEDVEITFSGGVLTVSGVRRTELGAGSDEDFYIRERFHGAFRRAITLPDGTGEDDIEAEFDNGLVEIVVRGGVTHEAPARISLRNRSGGATTRTLGDD